MFWMDDDGLFGLVAEREQATHKARRLAQTKRLIKKFIKARIANDMDSMRQAGFMLIPLFNRCTVDEIRELFLGIEREVGYR